MDTVAKTHYFTMTMLRRLENHEICAKIFATYLQACIRSPGAWKWRDCGIGSAMKFRMAN